MLLKQKGLIFINTPRTKEEVIQIFRRAGIDGTDDDIISRALDILEQGRKAEVEARRINRAEQRSKAKSEKERKARTHKLCQIGGTILSFYPDIALLSDEEINDLFDTLFVHPLNDEIVNTAIEYRHNKEVGDADG